MINVYIIDTSSLIEMKVRYPEDIFPTVWQKMDELYREGRLIAPSEVEKEIEVKDDELKKWTKDKREMFIKPNKDQVEKTKEIVEIFRFLAKSEKPASCNADPWLISLAIVRNGQEQEKLFPEKKYIIVTEESKTRQNRIPKVAESYGITCINLIELFKEEKWKF